MSDALVSTFFELVRIDSESGKEDEFLLYLKRLLEEEFKADCRLDRYGNLISSFPGKDSSALPVLFGCHADTVSPGTGIEPVLEGDTIRSKGETVLGADNKAGIAELIEAIRTADRHPPLEIVVTKEEETGLKGSRNLDFSQITAKVGFVVDGDLLDTVVIGGPSHMLIDVEITGKAAHAGMEPEKGISAIKAASFGIAMLKEGRVDDETTVNVGIIQGGQARNSVPDKAEVKAECRSLNHEKCLAQGELIKAVFEVAARAVGAKAKIESELAYKAVSIPEDAKVVEIAKQAVASVGITPKVKVICGGTDASIYNEKGIQCVVIGTGVQQEHTTDECIAVSDMEKAVKMIRRIFNETSM
ncbi:MAG TPA: M20/M25/M40 family metallo-hydrolase [Bacillota bacterium]|nr:M20/M25/M40 family metallo-hydrolase [Bacillota bacterium]